MSSSPKIPGFIVGGGSAGKGVGSNAPGQLREIYANLQSGAADLVTGLHAKVLVMEAGAIGTAGAVQAGQTETAAEVADNLQVLGSIAAFCRANNITVQVDADLTYSATNSDGSNALLAQWGTAAASAGLPISSIEDVQEIGISQNPGTFASYATIEANAVKTLIRDYSNSTYKLTAQNLGVGDMEGGGATSVSVISEWWNAYNLAAQSAGIQKFSFTSADVGWLGPWIDPLSTPANDGFLEALSTLCASQKMTLNVVVEGSQTDPSASQYVIQSEQNAIHLAEMQALGLVNVGNIVVRSWDVQPVGIGEITSPTSMISVTAELEAVYPLYENGRISAQGIASVSAPGQILLNTGVAKPLPLLSLQWTASDVIAGNNLGVVVIDQTGALSATQHGSGSVSNDASNILVLSGNSADLAFELSSITLTEGSAGPDTIDIETFGSTGRLSDTQINVLAGLPGQSVASINSTSNLQGWLSSSSVLNTGTVIAGNSILTSETLHWSTSGTLTGTIVGTTAAAPSAFVKTDTIHEPLAEYGIENAPGSLIGTTVNQVVDIYDPKVDNQAFPSGGYANNAGVNDVAFAPIPGWLANSFNPASQLTPMIVQSTTNTFDPVTGRLETSVDYLAPDPLSVTDLTGTHSDLFTVDFNNGGTQVTEINTGTNPAWEAEWGNQFSSVTLTYDGSGHLVEAFLQGGQSNPLFTIDDVFDPISGQLWEQFQSTTPPPEALGTTNYAMTNNPYYAGFATGPSFVTQFKGSPNWDSSDWGTTVSVDTEVWVDNFIINNFAGLAINFPAQYTADLNAYPYQFVNGTALDLMYLPGTIAVDLNKLGNVVIDSLPMVSGLVAITEIDAAGATGSVSITGLTTGGSTLIGGDNTSTIIGYGHDTIVVGAGTTDVNTGNGGSTVLISDPSGNVTVSGVNDVINIVSGGAVHVAGSGETINGSNLMIYVSSDTSIFVNGTNDVINLIGSGIALNVPGNNMVLVEGAASSVAANFDALQSLSVGGKIASIALTDSGKPTLALSAAQIQADASVLALIKSPYQLFTIVAPTPVPDPTPITIPTPVPNPTPITIPTPVPNPTPITIPTPVPDPTPITIPTPAANLNPSLVTNFICNDTITGQTSNSPGTSYVGPVSGIADQYINITSDSLNIIATNPSCFIHSGSGDDAIDASRVSGVAVIDGGTGSNFLVGGSGNTTFFADDRNAQSSIWSTISNLHSGDSATVWGVSSQDFSLQWVNNQGAVGYTGLTLHAMAAGAQDAASITLTGFSTADLSNGRLSLGFGVTPDTANAPGSKYLNILLNESGFIWVGHSTRRPVPVRIKGVAAKARPRMNQTSSRVRRQAGNQSLRGSRLLWDKTNLSDDKDILGIVLSIALSRKRAKPVVRALLKKYHTFRLAIAAGSSDLLATRGLGMKGVAALKLVQASIVNPTFASQIRLSKFCVIGIRKGHPAGGSILRDLLKSVVVQTEAGGLHGKGGFR